MARSDANTIDATRTSIEILEYVVEAEEPVGISHIAEDLDISKSLVYNHLSTLRGLEYVVKSGRKYAPGLRSLQLGDRVRQGLDVYEHGEDHIENLATATGETVELFVMEEHYGVPVRIVRSLEDWTSPHRIGERIPLHLDSPGKAILASLSPERAEEKLSASISAAPADESPDADAVRKDIKRIRDSGVAFTRGELHSAVVAIGSPIETTGSTRPAALAIVGPADRLEGRYLEEDLVGQLISTSQAISVAMTE